MGKGKWRAAIGWVLSGLVLMLGFSPASNQLRALPEHIRLSVGSTTDLSFSSPLKAELSGADQQVLSSFDESIENGNAVVSIAGGDVGDAQLVVKLLGVPVKTVNVSVQPERMLTPGGQSVGVAIRTSGVLVVGASDVGAMPSPARLAGLKSGDLIERVDGIDVESASHLSELLSTGEQVELDIARGEDALCMNLTPVKDDRDGVYRLGAWVRDSTAGVGTLSFYDPQTHSFGALGHAITDVDTGTVLSIGDGGIYESKIIGVLKGLVGEPGELMGEFAQESQRIGDVRANGELGIYGESYDPVVNELYPEGLPIATRDEVSLGAAQILTTLDDAGIKAYDCEIVKLFRQDEPRQRSMVVKITDEELLEKTGGIVQGMSGSPIVQNDRIIGAVTHVYVNDPTQGYGVYIEWMLTQCA